MENSKMQIGGNGRGLEYSKCTVEEGQDEITKPQSRNAKPKTCVTKHENVNGTRKTGDAKRETSVTKPQTCVTKRENVNGTWKTGDANRETCVTMPQTCVTKQEKSKSELEKNKSEMENE